MKITALTILLLISSNVILLGQIEVPNPFKNGQLIKIPKMESAQKEADKLLRKVDGKSPISTSFDDAIYEAEVLKDFEPAERDYRLLEIQPTTETGGFRIKSGIYTMNCRSFCLKAGTYGPSRGDGHLLAPLKGKKAEFVQAILERYGKKPTIPQGNIQVLLWAIVAGADMNNIHPEYMKTLNELFTADEILKYKGKDYLKGMADKEIGELKQKALGEVSPQLQKIFDADNKIRAMISQNFAYKEMETIAVLAGIAPEEDKIREVSKGRWSYHPDGFFVRFFPNGYAQTRVDVYVPFEGEVLFVNFGKVKGLNSNKGGITNEVIYHPSKSVAAPANRSSQRIAQSSVPEASNNKYQIVFLSYDKHEKKYDAKGAVLIPKSLFGHIFIAFVVNGKVIKVRGFNPNFKEIDFANLTDDSELIPYSDDIFAVFVDKITFYNSLEVKKDFYFLGYNDCVTYADEIAAMIGLNRPKDILPPSDYAKPWEYFKYVKKHN